MTYVNTETADPVVLAFDTANEVIALGVGRLNRVTREICVVASVEVAAHRASNTKLLPCIDETLRECGISRDEIACVCVGRGPGSFTGVRIAMATAKGIASALSVALIGVSTLDAVAWQGWASGLRGSVAVVADAMRKEVYPVRYMLQDATANESAVQRLEADRVVKAELAASELAGGEGANLLGALPLEAAAGSALILMGDGLKKYAELFLPCGQFAEEQLWTPTGRGLLLALQAAWRSGMADPFDAARHNPAYALPVYTRLSDAEENERIRLAKNDPRNLTTGVNDVAEASLRRDQRATMHDSAVLNARADASGVTYKPLDAAHAGEVAALEREIMGTDAWSEALVKDELPRPDRVWWAAYTDDALGGASAGQTLVGYAGGWIVDGQVQILKVGVAPEARRRGIARELLARVAADARDLGAQECSLEVRAANAGAQALYEALGFHALGTRPRYYSDGEDALIMQGPLPIASHDVAGMELQIDAARATQVTDEHDIAADAEGKNAFSCEEAPSSKSEGAEKPSPRILAIESSCDETAAALVDGAGELLSDVVASQIDFHARFGGVVPEIASRKHIEAICGVCDECLEQARMNWENIDAVAVTYAPGLVGALVVGVAFGKGAAWALEVPFIGVHHLEGHLYANKIGAPDFAPPAVVSLVSGGNTMLVYMRDWGDYETLGSTIDDAVGEAFDKVAKALGLGYPGGPIISREAAKGDPDAIAFPRAMMHSGDLRFSLSGLKTAVVTYINSERAAGHTLNIPDICASFQQAVVDVQVKKATDALKQTGAKTFCLGGGVAANPRLRQAYEEMCERLGVRLIMPPLSACGDNAGMIALVALDRYAQERFFGLDADAYAHANLDEPY